MPSRGVFAALAPLLLLSSLSAQEETALRARWADGLRLEAADGPVAVRGNLRIHWDAAGASRDSAVEARTGTLQGVAGLRRARILLRGRLGEHLRWRSETDFRSGAPKFLSQYGEADLGAGVALRGGHFREPFGFEANTSGSHLLFLERSPVSELAPGRNSGLMVHGVQAARRVSWAAGVFRDSDPVGRGTGPGGWAVTARVGVRPWADEDGGGWLHLGLAASARDPAAGAFQVEATPETTLLPAFVATGPLPASQVRGAGLEIALASGGWTMLGEWTRWEVAMPAGGDPDLHGATLQLGWLPGTGRRSFHEAKVGLGGVQVLAAGGPAASPALELVARGSFLDLREAAAGQRLEDFSAGLNLHFSPSLRVGLDLVRARVQGLPAVWIPMLRLALDL